MMATTITISTNEPAAPAGDTGQTLCCPLCDYDLRGQIEPRCPECGYRFSWEELRDPTRRAHPYLFEHHPWRPLALPRTLLGTLRPRRFWARLYPTQPSRPKWLVVYALVVVLVALLPAAIYLGATVYALHVENAGARPRTVTWLVTPQGKVELASLRMTAPQYLDAVHPVFPSPQLFRQAAGDRLFLRLFIYPSIPLAWAGATGLAMMVFQVSMRRARVRSSHVWRCVVYCGDAALWAALPSLFLMGSYALTYRQNGSSGWPAIYVQQLLQELARWLPELVRWLAVAAVVVFVYRFAVALSKYLRFEHVVATVAATVALAGMTVALLVLQFRDVFLVIYADWRW